MKRQSRIVKGEEERREKEVRRGKRSSGREEREKREINF